MTHYFHYPEKASAQTVERTRSTIWAGTLRTRDGTCSSSVTVVLPSLGAKDARRALRDIRFAVYNPPSTQLAGMHHGLYYDMPRCLTVLPQSTATPRTTTASLLTSHCQFNTSLHVKRTYAQPRDQVSCSYSTERCIFATPSLRWLRRSSNNLLRADVWSC
jgi:hypothetical protein